MKRVVFLILIVFGTKAPAQKLPDFGTNRIRISADDRIIQAELLPLNSDPQAETDQLYYWYSSNKIHTTQGGYSGRLLNGHYIEYFLNKNIKEEGVFKKGLKDGVWKVWDESGTLQQSITWKGGVKQGNFVTFDKKGAIKQQGKYSKNLLMGTVTTFDTAGKATAAKYKEGKIVIDSPSKFWAKVRAKAKILKKKTQSPTKGATPENRIKGGL